MELVLGITKKPTDADLQAKLPPKPVLTGDRNDDILLRMYDVRKRQIEKEHSHAVMKYDEKVRIAAVVRRVYNELDHTLQRVAADQFKLKAQAEGMRLDIQGIAADQSKNCE